MAAGDNSVAGSNTVYTIAVANNSAVSQSQFPISNNNSNSNAEVELSELVDTFSISNLEKETSSSQARSQKLSEIPWKDNLRLGAANYASHFLDALGSSSGSITSEEQGTLLCFDSILINYASEWI